jgi:magnesium chelatase subunit ChlI-like protein
MHQIYRLPLLLTTGEIPGQKVSRLRSFEPKLSLPLVRPSFANVNLMKATFLGKLLLKSVRSFVQIVLMAGSPGSGKTLLARAVPGILPEMSIEESLDVTRMYSVADQLSPGMALIKHDPSTLMMGYGYGAMTGCE